MTLRESEKQLILATLHKYNGSRKATCAELKIGAHTLSGYLRKWGIRPHDKGPAVTLTWEYVACEAEPADTANQEAQTAREHWTDKPTNICQLGDLPPGSRVYSADGEIDYLILDLPSHDGCSYLCQISSGVVREFSNSTGIQQQKNLRLRMRRSDSR